MDSVVIYSDGSCLNNPGYGGWASILIHPDTQSEKVISGYSDEITTNNRMELLAIIHAMECLKRASNVIIYLDSDYVANGLSENRIQHWMSKNWRTGRNKEIKNIDLWERLYNSLKHHKIEVCSVKSHSGIEYNERVDYEARRQAKLVKMRHE